MQQLEVLIVMLAHERRLPADGRTELSSGCGARGRSRRGRSTEMIADVVAALGSGCSDE
jgi:hypothetical protein